MHMFQDGGYYLGGMHGLWWIFWVVLVVLLVFFAWGRPGATQQAFHETPLQVLQRRLAHGDVSPEEFEKRKALL